MPWKIRNIELDGEAPAVQLHDPKNRIYMDVEMTSPREAHIYLGDQEPERARLYVVVDESGVLVSRAEGYGHWDLMVVDSILETMGFMEDFRTDALRELRDNLPRKKRRRRKPRQPEVIIERNADLSGRGTGRDPRP